MGLKKFAIWSWIKKCLAKALQPFGIILPTILAVWGLILTYRQITMSEDANRTSIAIAHFDTLLRNTDTIILSLSSQIKLIEEQKKATYQSNKYKFIGAVFYLGNKIHTQQDIKILDENAKNLLEPYINDLRDIFESQLNNPYLYTDSTML